jgi:hypothetical protein
MLTRIISKIKLFTKSENKILLGRWTIDDCNNIRNIKIDFSNEDHCGSCDQYRLNKISTLMLQNNNTEYIVHDDVILVTN